MNKFLQQSKILINLALPITATSLANMIAGFIGMWFVAHLGKNYLAAGALATSSYIPLFVICSTCLYSISILVSSAIAKNNQQNIGNVIRNGFCVATLLGVPASVLIWNLGTILQLFGQEPKLIQLCVPYFHFAAFGILPGMWSYVVSQFFIGISRPQLNLKFILVSTPFNLILSYGFVFGKLGLPQLGLAGIALASTIMFWMIFIAIILYVKFKKEFQHYQIIVWNTSWINSTYKEILNLGAPIGLQFGGELAAMALSTYFMGWYGSDPLAASQIVTQFNYLVVMVFLGITQASSVLASHAFGKNDLDHIKEITYNSLILGIAIMASISLIYFFLPKYLIAVYLDPYDPSHQSVVHLAHLFFMISAVGMIVDGARNILSGCLRGLHDSKTPMRISLFCLWVISTPVSYIFGFIFNWGPVGLRIGFFTGFVICVAILLKRFWERCAMFAESEERTQSTGDGAQEVG